MLYSPNHKFLMLRNLKVGGTSLEVELSKVLPENAIVTEIFPTNKEHYPRNCDGFYNHMPYIEIESKINLLDVKSYVFVRNPYDIQLSMFFYKLKLKKLDWKGIDKIKKEELLDKFFFEKTGDFRMLKSTKYIYSNKDEILVNSILKYELGIESQINNILTNHKIKNIHMNTFEKQHRPKEYTVKNTFRKEYLDIIYDEWIWEFNMFGYNK